MSFRALALLVLPLAGLAGCKPAPEAEKPLHPAFAGWWAHKPEACLTDAVRFDEKRIVLRRKDRMIPLFEILSADVSASGAELELKVAEAAAYEAVRSADRADKLLEKSVRIAFSRYDNRLAVRDLQIREQSGLRMPTRGERERIIRQMNFTRCAAVA